MSLGGPLDHVGMSLLRAGSAALFYAGFTRTIDDCASETCGDNHGELMMLAGLGVWSAAAVYDMIDAPRAAARANARFTIGPIGAGMALAGTF